MHLFASLPIAVVLMLKRSCLLMLETGACAAGEQTKLVSVDVTAQSRIFSFGPAQSRMNGQSNKSLLKLVLE